jgi:hypothetical protein
VRLLRRRQQPEPVDRGEEWAGLLNLYRTRSSGAMQRELYKQKARERREAKAAVPPPPTPLMSGFEQRAHRGTHSCILRLLYAGAIAT